MYRDKYDGIFVQQIIIMEAFFNLCGNQTKHCDKMEQRDLLSGLSTTLN